MRTPSHAAWWLLVPAIGILGLVGMIPLIAVFNYAFFDIFTLESRFWVGGEWFSALLTGGEFYAALARSLLFSTLVVCIQFPLGIAIALLIPRQGVVASAMLMILAVPLVVPWNLIPAIWLSLVHPDYGPLMGVFRSVGWAFDYKFTALHTWILILAMDTWHWLGLIVILAYAGLSAIPAPYYQAARIDGAGPWQVFWFIQRPKMQGVLLMALLLRVVDSLMIYTEAFGINAGGPNHATTFLTLQLGEEIAGFDYGPAAARSVLYFLIVLCVAWAFRLAQQRMAE